MITTAPTEAWAALATAVAGAIAVVVKKRMNRNRPPVPRADHISRTEFHQGLDAMRDRMTATFMAIGEKMDQNQKEVLSALAHQGVIVEQRLDKIEATVARLDERTK